MNKTAYILLAEGFEETEALVPYDILKRGGVNVTLVSISSSRQQTSSHGVTIVAHGPLPTVSPTMTSSCSWWHARHS